MLVVINFKTFSLKKLHKCYCSTFLTTNYLR